MNRRFSLALICALLLSAQAAAQSSPQLTPQQLEFFESRVRPILARKCFKCHSSKAKDVKGGLKLDSYETIHRGGDSGKAVVPGKPAASLLIKSIQYEAQASEMPPDGKLAKRDIATLIEWVKIGAPFPKSKATRKKTKDAIDWKKERASHWAWRPIAAVKAKGIDELLIGERQKLKTAANPAASKRDLLRRAYWDLIGLPPKPAEVAAFIADKSSNAFAKVVDGLLQRPQYGERWGRHWLDVARYSDGFGGFSDNRKLPLAWRYRDWVVQSFNKDMPYDVFVRYQIAGDLITPEARVGTGFFALGPFYKSDGGDPDSVAQAKSETLDDRVDTLTRGFLAITVSCARCHDHKFDPIPQVDYYSLAGIFNNSHQVTSPFGDKPSIERYNKARQRVGKLDGEVKKYNREIRKNKRKATKDELAKLAKMQAELKAARQDSALRLPTSHGLADRGSGDMRVALRGNLRKPGPVAPRRMLRLLTGEPAPKYKKGSGRLQLAMAITDPKNPLLARVIVNRVWMHHFGRAIVRSPSNFGTLGQRPSHPQLLDYLAYNLIQNKWSLKWLHRTIMLSEAYQLSSQLSGKAFGVDGDNRSIWRMNPRRMDVESWRDSLLSVTGELDSKMGGPSVGDLLGSKRRTLYSRTSRTGDQFRSDLFLRLFDFPIPRATIAKRVTSTVPQQYLFMMNSPFMVARAKAFTKRLHSERKSNDKRITRAYQLLFSRDPKSEEMQLGLEFLTSAAETKENAKLTVWEQYAQVLLSSNEFLFVK